MEMHQVRYFVAVACERNFTRAAKRCNVTQPALTRAIQALEHELGGCLFMRDRSGARLTELGELVRPHLEQIHERSTSLKAEALAFARADHVRLRLGIMCTIAPGPAIGLIAEMERQFGDVEIVLEDAGGDQLHQALLCGGLEAGIYCSRNMREEHRIHALPLFNEQMMIVVGREHRLAEKPFVSFKDLDGERYLLRTNCEFSGFGAQFFEQQDARIKEIAYRSDREDWIQAMAAAGLGFAFLPEHCVTHPGVVARPLSQPSLWRTVNLVTVRGRRHSPALGALVRAAMRMPWFGHPALAVAASGECPTSDAIRAVAAG